MLVHFVEGCFELHCALELPRSVHPAAAVLSENAAELLPHSVAILETCAGQKSFTRILAIVLHQDTRPFLDRSGMPGKREVLIEAEPLLETFAFVALLAPLCNQLLGFHLHLLGLPAVVPDPHIGEFAEVALSLSVLNLLQS